MYDTGDLRPDVTSAVGSILSIVFVSVIGGLVQLGVFKVAYRVALLQCGRAANGMVVHRYVVALRRPLRA